MVYFPESSSRIVDMPSGEPRSLGLQECGYASFHPPWNFILLEPQTFDIGEVEIIVVNDGLTEDVEGSVTASGRADTRNAGIELAQGFLPILLDADIRLVP